MGQGAGKVPAVTAAPPASAVESTNQKENAIQQDTIKPAIATPQGPTSQKIRIKRNEISPQQGRNLQINNSKISDKMPGSYWDEQQGTFMKSSLRDFKKSCLETKKQVDETIQKLISLHILPQTTKPATNNAFKSPKKHIFNINRDKINNPESNNSNSSRQQLQNLKQYTGNRKGAETERLEYNNHHPYHQPLHLLSDSPGNPRRNNYVSSLDPIRPQFPSELNSARKIYAPPKSVKELMKPTKISNSIRYVKAPLQQKNNSALQVRLILENNQYRLEQMDQKRGDQSLQEQSSPERAQDLNQPLVNSYVEEIQIPKKVEIVKEPDEEVSIFQLNKPKRQSEQIIKSIEMNKPFPTTAPAAVNQQSSSHPSIIQYANKDIKEIKPYPPSIVETLENNEEDFQTKSPSKLAKISVKDRLLALEKLPPIRVDLSKLPPPLNRILPKAKDPQNRKINSEGAYSHGRDRKTRMNSVDKSPPTNRRLDTIKHQYLEKYLGQKS